MKKPQPQQAPSPTSQRAAASRTAKSATVHHSPGNDNLVVYLSVIAFAAIFGVLLVWVYHSQQQQLASPDKTYFKMDTVRFQTNDFSVRATLALQSTTDDLGWLKKNKTLVQQFLDKRLQDEKPANLVSTSPKKLPELQTNLTEDLNKQFPQANIQQVLFTEFLTSHDSH